MGTERKRCSSQRLVCAGLEEESSVWFQVSWRHSRNAPCKSWVFFICSSVLFHKFHCHKNMPKYWLNTGLTWLSGYFPFSSIFTWHLKYCSLCSPYWKRTNAFQTLKQISMSLKGSSPQRGGWIPWKKKYEDHMTDSWWSVLTWNLVQNKISTEQDQY